MKGASMNMPDYSSMLFEELSAHKKQLDAAYADKHAKAEAEFLIKTQEQANALGFNLGNGAHKGRKGPAKGNKALVRYRDPDNPANTWSGRGKPTKWLAELIDAGKDKEDYRVKA
jgi:DNA-binding protein H-NS